MSSTILERGRRTAKDLAREWPNADVEASLDLGGVAGEAFPEAELDEELDAGPIGRPLYSGEDNGVGRISLEVGRAPLASKASKTLTIAFR